MPESFRRRKGRGKTYDERGRAELDDRNWDGAKKMAEGLDFWYVENEVLLDDDAVAQIRGDFDGRRSKEDLEFAERAKAAGLPLRKFFVDGGDLPALVDNLRKADRKVNREVNREDELKVSLNTMLRGEPAYKGGPGAEPRPAQALPVNALRAERGDADIAVLDTGVWAHFGDQPLLAGVVTADATDTDDLDVDGSVGLDTQACHGTFICGLVAMHAGGLGIDPGKVLDSTGVGDDASIALELAETKAPVVNLSLGGYTDGDRPPLALQQALEVFWPERVVVAAAGNNDSDRPFWPAAFKHVIAVGALDTTQQGAVRARFSNYGSWVDVWAPGVSLVSAYADEGFLRGLVPGWSGWASWSGTSFAAPLVAAEIARRAVGGSARDAAMRFLAELPAQPIADRPNPAGPGLVYLPETVALAPVNG